MNLPSDADGDVIRSLSEQGVDLSVEHIIDFEIDLESWPPSPLLLDALRDEFSLVSPIEPTDEFDGYINLKVKSLVTYVYVTEMQKYLSNMAAPYGGRCEAWGVWSGT